MKRVFLTVLDSFGVGGSPDSALFGDNGVNTLKSCYDTGLLQIPTLRDFGLFNIDGIDFGEKSASPLASFGRASEKSRGKDTVTGHWEIAGLVTNKPFPTYPDGFDEDILAEFSKAVGRGVLCNKPYSGTKVIADYGKEHMETGSLIVYTSQDSVFQIAAHEDVVSTEELYNCCLEARKVLPDIGRIIARPFTGKGGNFTRTLARRDFALSPHGLTVLDLIKDGGFDVISIGKINDIFCGTGITKHLESHGNKECMDRFFEALDTEFEGLCFINLVDFDSTYGHRNDAKGYANALNEFDSQLKTVIEKMKDDDILIICADHGCDPGYTITTDHTREYVPILCYGKNVRRGVNIGTRGAFCDIGVTAAEYLGVSTGKVVGESFLDEIMRQI